MNTEKLISKNDIDNAYDQLINIISTAYSDISRLNGVNHKFDDIQQRMSQALESKVQDAKTVLNQTKNKTVWDNLVIAFFGETNAGKSTIIETFRILFDRNRKKEDGLIVGDGQHDFTKTYNEYKLSISGKPFTLIDVPGIEGKEEDFKDSIKTALQKAHIVFYVNGHNKKPDEATAKKIKDYLGDWVKVYSIYNVRGSVSNYDEEEERKTLLTNGVKKNESLIRAEFKRILGDVYVGNLTIQAQLAMCAKASFSKKREDLIKYQQKLLKYFANTPERILQFSQFQTIINLVDEKSVNFKQEIIEANKQKLISLASRIADDISNTMASQKSYVERLKTNLNVAEREICNNLLNNAQHNISSSVKNMIDSSFGDLKSYAFSCIDTGDSNLAREVEAYQRRRFGNLSNDIAVSVKENLRKIEQTSNRKLKELDGVNIKPLSLHTYINIDAEIDFSNAFDELDIDFSDVVNWAGKTAGTAAAGAAIGSVIPGLGTVIGAAIGGIVGGVIHAASGDGGKADARKSVSDAINKAKAKADRDISNSLAPVFENLRRVSKEIKNAIQTEKRNIYTLQNAIDVFDIDINRYASQLKQQRYGRI
ncbi:MAG: GTPase domain-containing protein [Candidatus Onthomorpha sp.]